MSFISNRSPRAGIRWISLCLAIAVSACVSNGAQERDPNYVYRSGDSYVRLVPVEPNGPTNSHPLAISAERLRQLLAGMEVSGAETIGRTPVFTSQELGTLAPPLALALSRAGPNQDVIFAVVERRGLFGRMAPKTVTTGRVFAKEGSLNLIFGLMQARLEPQLPDYAGVDPTTAVGSRSARTDFLWRIELGSGRLNASRGDWVVFDRSAISAAAPEVSTSDDPNTGDVPAAPTGDRKVEEIENRLRLLDSLRQRGAITEEEYRERRRAILDQL